MAIYDGGGVFIKAESDVSFEEVLFTNNSAGSRGGGIYDESDDMAVLTSFFKNNSARISGGAVYAAGDGVIVADTAMEDNMATEADGGALCCESSSGISIRDSTFFRNFAGGSGGACSFADSSYISVKNVAVLSNNAAGAGGAIHSVQSDNFDLSDSAIHGNAAQMMGGAVYVNDCNNVSYWNNSFVENIVSAGSGSAIWASAAEISMSSNVFNGNICPHHGGTVFWMFSSGMNEPIGLFDNSNSFFNNIALYGENYATESVEFMITTESSLQDSDSSTYVISEYHVPIVVNVLVRDFYDQLVLSDNHTYIQILVGEENNCGNKHPTLSGTTVEQIHMGSAKFESLFGFCIPGGNMSVKVSGMVGSSSLESPEMKWAFRGCLRGEYYRDSECSECERGYYSKEDNADLSVRECKPCPENARDCYADVIVLDKGYWALSRDSEYVTECPLGKSSCIGGVQNVDAELVNDGRNSSICGDGYTGVLCAVCSDQYFFAPGSSTCEPCSEAGLNVFFIVLLCLLLLFLCIPIVLIVLSWTGSTTLDSVIAHLSLPSLLYLFYMKLFVVVDKNKETDEERRKREERLNIKFLRIMPKFKIFVSMFQITSSMPAVFAMSFPPFFSKVSSFFGVLNFDIVANLGLSCQFDDVDYVDYLVMTCLGPLLLCVVLSIMYYIHRFFLIRRKAEYDEAARVYSKYLLVFLLGTYFLLPGISVYIFQMYSCQDVDPDDVLHGEDLYLRADVSIKCGSPRHHIGTTFATCMIFVYPIGVPLLYYWLLYQVKEGIINRDGNISPVLKLEIMPTSFLYSSYEPQFWYWEIIETIRRILMTGVLVLVAQGTSVQIVVTLLLTLIFIKMYAHFTPFNDDILDTDAEFAQYQVFFVVFIALLIKEDSVPSMEDAWGPLLVFVIFSLLLLSPIRLFKEKCLPDKIKHLVNVDHENYDRQLEGLKVKERQARRGSLMWAKSIGIDNENYHSDGDSDSEASGLFSQRQSLRDDEGNLQISDVEDLSQKSDGCIMSTTDSFGERTSSRYSPRETPTHFSSVEMSEFQNERLLGKKATISPRSHNQVFPLDTFEEKVDM